MRATLSILAGLLTAALLIVFLLSYSGVTANQLGEWLKRPNGLQLFGIFLASTAHMAFGAFKWRTIVSRIAPAQTARAGRMFFMFYTTVSAALAQFIMVHVASLLVRGLAGRIHHNVPFIHGAAASVFEQLFDVYILLVFAVSGIIGWTFALSPAPWFAVTTVVLLMGWLMLSVTLRFLKARATLDLGTTRLARTVTEWIGTCIRLGLVEPRLVSRLYTFSVLRYLSMLARVAIVVSATTPALPLFDSVLGFTVVQTSQLIAITPGSLGITEWTWTGFMALQGYPPDIGTAFSLALRILSYASILAVLAVTSVLFAAETWHSGKSAR